MGAQKVKVDKHRKTSVAWSFFKAIDAGSVQCLLCSRYLHRKSNGSTTSMLRHLRLKHPATVIRKELGQEAKSAVRHLRLNHPAEVSQKELGQGAESAVSQDNQSMEVDGDQIISVIVEMDDGDSVAQTPLNNSDVNPADGGVFKTCKEGPADQITHTEASDGCLVRSTRRRSLIWRLFEHLESLNAARCRICKKKLLESGGISNLRRHLMKRHPNVLSELLASSHQHPTSLHSVVATVSHKAFFSAENRQDPVVFVDNDSEILTKLTETEGPVINSLTDALVEGSAQKTIHAEGPEADGGTGETSWNGNQNWISVDVELQDGNSDVTTPSNETDSSPVTNDQLDTLQEDSSQQTTHEDGSEDRSVKHKRRRSLIWRHFERLESLEAARCRICMKKLQCFESGCTSNLHRHMSKRHPKAFSELISNRQQHQSQSLTNKTNEDSSANTQKEILGTKDSVKVSRVSEVEIRVFKQERELIEALRRTQKEEARTLEHQRELVEKLRAASTREAAAEKKEIESLRNAQKEEAKELRRQREELEKEKVELQEKWEELHRERVELMLLSGEKEAT